VVDEVLPHAEIVFERVTGCSTSARRSTKSDGTNPFVPRRSWGQGTRHRVTGARPRTPRMHAGPRPGIWTDPPIAHSVAWTRWFPRCVAVARPDPS